LSLLLFSPSGSSVGLQPHEKSRAASASALPKDEAADFIAFAVAIVFLFASSAQKSHVKP
jgi:hypothetical protein